MKVNQLRSISLAVMLHLISGPVFSSDNLDEISEMVENKVRKYGELTGRFSNIKKTVRYDIKDILEHGWIDRTYVTLGYTDHRAIGGSGTTGASLFVAYPRQVAMEDYLKDKNIDTQSYLSQSIFIVPEASSRQANVKLPKVISDLRVVNNTLYLDALLNQEGDPSNFPSRKQTFKAEYNNGKWVLTEME